MIRPPKFVTVLSAEGRTLAVNPLNVTHIEAESDNGIATIHFVGERSAATSEPLSQVMFKVDQALRDRGE